MDLKKLVLLKLVCCGGPVLVLLLPSAMFSAATAVLVDGPWYIVAAGGAIIGVLLWRARIRLTPASPSPSNSCDADHHSHRPGTIRVNIFDYDNMNPVSHRSGRNC